MENTVPQTPLSSTPQPAVGASVTPPVASPTIPTPSSIPAAPASPVVSPTLETPVTPQPAVPNLTVNQTSVTPPTPDEPPKKGGVMRTLMLLVVLLLILAAAGVGAYYYAINSNLIGGRTPKKPAVTVSPTLAPEPTIEIIPTAAPEATTEATACTLDAKICADGSSVGRTGPNCEFAACPGEVLPTSSVSATPTI